MNILCVGDVTGYAGLDYLKKMLPQLKKQYNVDVCVANGENSHATGMGITAHEAQEMFACGVDVITTGNHCLRFTSSEVFEQTDCMLMPANFPYTEKTAGVCVLDKGPYKVAVINLIGTAFLEPVDNPFKTLDEALKSIDAKVVIVDFHAESTAEKKALAFYADGRVSAFFGTHTHVQTADEQVLPQGTGYISDVGMTGPFLSVLGVKPHLAIFKQKTHKPVKFEPAEGACMLNAALYDVDEKTGLCRGVQRINIM